MVTRLTAGLLALDFLAAVATEAGAIEKCKARIHPKTGEIEVSAAGVTGTPLWGGGPPDDAGNAFPDLATCQKGSSLKKCLLGAPGSYTAKVMPSSCTLSLRDDASFCAVHIQGCSGASLVAARVAEVGMAGNWQISRGIGAVSVNHVGTGDFEVRFDRAVDECFPSVTGQSQGGATACAHCGTTDQDVVVRIFDATGVLTDFNAAFYLVMHCP
jgi:hypothetical protein